MYVFYILDVNVYLLYSLHVDEVLLPMKGIFVSWLLFNNLFFLNCVVYILLVTIFYKMHRISYFYNLRFIFERIYLDANSIYTIKILGHVPEFGNDHTKPYKISVYYTWRKNGN